MEIGSLVQLDAYVDAFDSTNASFSLDPGTSALLLDYDDYDITLLVQGKVLYIPAIDEESIMSPVSLAK